MKKIADVFNIITNGIGMAFGLLWRAVISIWYLVCAVLYVASCLLSYIAGIGAFIFSLCLVTSNGYRVYDAPAALNLFFASGDIFTKRGLRAIALCFLASFIVSVFFAFIRKFFKKRFDNACGAIYFSKEDMQFRKNVLSRSATDLFFGFVERRNNRKLAKFKKGGNFIER